MKTEQSAPPQPPRRKLSDLMAYHGVIARKLDKYSVRDKFTNPSLFDALAADWDAVRTELREQKEQNVRNPAYRVLKKKLGKINPVLLYCAASLMRFDTLASQVARLAEEELTRQPAR